MVGSTKEIHVTHIISGLDVGGAEIALYRLLSLLDNTMIKSSVVCLVNRGDVGKDIEMLGIPVYYLDMRSGAWSVVKFIKLVVILKHLKPDIIQGWMYHGNLFATVASFLLPRRLILYWNVRSSGTGSTYDFKKKMFYWSIGQLSRFPIKIINNSIASTKVHEQRWNYPSDRWVIIPNGFDTEVFKPNPTTREEVRNHLDIGPETILIGHIARYDPMKDHRNFLLAARDLVGSGGNIHIVMIGLNVDQNNRELTRFIADLGLGERTHLLGSRREIPFLISGLDLGCLSSSYDEGFPNVIGEMMSGGIPCVVTDVGDCAHVVGNTGRVVPIRDPASLAVALKELIKLATEEREKLGGEARQRVIENFSLGSVVNQYEQIYMQASESGRGN